jgi:hypothetical protein
MEEAISRAARTNGSELGARWLIGFGVASAGIWRGPTNKQNTKGGFLFIREFSDDEVSC